eukprot:TRINITY_DN248_c0_g1_i3.p1 TRINITY_DN248_c0_g1~~TRINITY_DN248_c0_g1_i3.p1  ORF type:complete len:1147 (-),score=292.60 TRINITY_DN248_c0_g1_i3:179-3619(-)
MSLVGSQTLGAPLGSPTVTTSGLVLLGRGASVAVLAASTLSVLWTAPTSGNVVSSVSVSCDGIMFAASGSTVFAFGASTGGCSGSTYTRSRTQRRAPSQTRTMTHETRTRTATHQTRTRTATVQTRTRTVSPQTRTRTRTATHETRTRTRSVQTRTATGTATSTPTRTATHETRTRTRSVQTRTATGTATSTPTQTRTRRVVRFTAELSGNLVEVKVVFSMAVAAVQGSASCAPFFPNWLLETLGAGALCRFPSATELVVSLGPGPTIAVGSTVEFVAGSIAAAGEPGTYVGGTAALTLAAGVPAPAVDISGPQQVGSCAGVTLVATATQTGGRAVEYVWSVVSPVGAPVSVPGTSVAEWVVPADEMDPGTTYVFGVQATNFLGQTSALASITVEKLVVAAPTLTGPSSVTASTEWGERETIIFSLEPAACTPSGTVWTAAWSFAAGSPTFVLDEATRTTLALSVATSTLTIGAAYTLVLTVSAASLGVAATATVALQRSGAALVAQLNAPATVQLDQALVLDASGSFDPDATSEPAVFSWGCALCAEGSTTACSETCTGFVGGSSATLTLAAGALLVSRSYVLTVRYAKGARSDSESRLVTVLPPSQVTVTISITQPNVLTQLTTTVSLNSSVCSTANPSVEVVIVPSTSKSVSWAFEPVASDANSVPASVGEQVLQQSLFEDQLRIQAPNMVDWYGYVYRFRIRALVLGSEVGRAEVCFVVGRPPVLSSFSTTQSGSQLRVAMAVSPPGTYDFVIGYKDPGVATRHFIAQRRSATPTTVRYDLVSPSGVLLLPCPTTEIDVFAFVCLNGVCLEDTLEGVPLNCVFKRRGGRRALPRVDECLAIPSPMDQSVCAVQAVQQQQTSEAASEALAVLRNAVATTPASPLTLMIFAGHHAEIVMAAESSDLSVLQQLLEMPVVPLAPALEALFASVEAQIDAQCSADVDATLALFGNKMLEATVCAGTPQRFVAQDGHVGVAAGRVRVVEASGSVAVLAVGGNGVSEVVLSFGAGAGTCASVTAAVTAPDCGDGVPFVLTVGSDLGAEAVTFRADHAGTCVAWNTTGGVWTSAECERNGADLCTCSWNAAGKYSVVPSKGSSSSPSAGVVAGSVVAAVAGVVLAAVAAVLLRKKMRRGEGEEAAALLGK